MSTPSGSDYTEDTLVEQPAIALFAGLGWQTANCYHEKVGPGGTLGRETRAEVVLRPRLEAALRRLNPALPAEALAAAREELTRPRGAQGPAGANREVYRLLKDGVKASYRDAAGAQQIETVRVISWTDPQQNDFFLASQFWITGDTYTRRADLVGFVNGLPLVFVELKAPGKSVQAAYDDNLRDYKTTIPQLFWYNALIILSNGLDTRVGSLTATWEHFAEWKKIDREDEPATVSLETAIRGTCAPARLLDLVENFTLFNEAGGGLAKLIARYHQYLGVNNAVAALRNLGANRGRLGVFWHTQGSGKSYSMVFFSQKVLRTVPGNWTFLVVTDRDDLDDQIYKTFAATGAVTEPEDAVHAASGAHLQQLLRENHRTVFTLIQKFHVPAGATYPQLSARADIVVMTDEAHRSQYDTLALNMRNALPGAAFIGFTGTPLLAGEEKTREVFGDYVSIYNFKQSLDDNATVPLYYENRIPALQLTNADLNAEMEALIEAAALDEAQERRLEREFARQYHLITRDDRLDTIAADLVDHFIARGYLGKAMLVSIDKVTAVRMYDKVQAHWAVRLADLRLRRSRAHGPAWQALDDQVRFMETTDMAVVISGAQNEEADFKQKGLDIRPHRQRMVKEDLAEKFKDPAHPLRLVFVCAMWMTGFDVPSLSTVYLDKPMRNHTLMQTIARANRVFAGKNNGLIVDYVGVFRNLQAALAIYGSAGEGTLAPGDLPVKDKRELVAALHKAIGAALAFCQARGISADAILAAPAADFARLKLLYAADNAIRSTPGGKKEYLALVASVTRLYHAILPDPAANSFTALHGLLIELARELTRNDLPANISGVMGAVETLLDASIAPDGYIIGVPAATAYDPSNRVDLGKINFAALQAQFGQYPHTVADRLQATLAGKLAELVRLNKTRLDYAERFGRLIDDYNSGATSIDLFFAQLTAFTQDLDAEARRHLAENLTEEELALFDLLTRPDLQLPDAEKTAVKQAAHDLLDTLKREKLVLDWRKRQQSRAQVRTTIEEVFDTQLPRSYDPVFQQKCDAVYQHIYDSYFGPDDSIYTRAA